MKLSSLLTEAIESIDGLLLEFLDSDDASKSLNSLIKYNKGEWKSEKQARFFLMNTKKYKTHYFDKDKLLAWARKHGYADKILVPTVHFIRGFGGGRSPSKQRYWGQIFVLDGGGVVARFKMKGISGGGGKHGQYAINWSKPGKVTFERKGEPSNVYFDIGQAEKEDRKREIEKKKRIKDNQKYIDLIKSIPNWDERDILESFIRQLEDGRTLSMSQLAIVRDLLPGKNLEIGDKKEWISAYDNFKSLIADKIVAPWIEIQKMASQREHEEWLRVSKMGEVDIGDMTGWEGAWEYPKEPDTEKDVAPYIKFLADMRSKGHGESDWVERRVFEMVAMQVYGDRETRIYRDASDFEDIKDQYNRAIKAKRPTKKAIRVITYILKAAKKLKAMNDAAIREWIVNAYYTDFPELATKKFSEQPKKPMVVKKPPQQPKKSIGYVVPSPAELAAKKPSQQLKKAIGYTIPSPSKFGFQGKGS